MVSNAPSVPGCSKRGKGKTVSAQEWEIILNVAEYLKKEFENGNKLIFKANVFIAKTAAATGFGQRSITKIKQAGRLHESYAKTNALTVAFGKVNIFDLVIFLKIPFDKEKT